MSFNTGKDFLSENPSSITWEIFETKYTVLFKKLNHIKKEYPDLYERIGFSNNGIYTLSILLQDIGFDGLEKRISDGYGLDFYFLYEKLGLSEGFSWGVEIIYKKVSNRLKEIIIKKD